MSDSLYERFGRPAIGGLLMALAGLTVASVWFQYQEFGLEALPDAAVSVYIIGIVIWGFFREGFGTLRFRALLYIGIVLWGGVDFLTGSVTTFSYVLVGGGTVLLVRIGFMYRAQRTKPVYER